MQLELTPTIPTKQCAKCAQFIPITSFPKDRGRKDGLFMWCKSCAAASAKKNYERSEVKAAHRTVVRRNVRGIQTRIASLKAHVGCQVCGEHEPVCIDFHHVDPTTKSFNIAEIKKSNVGWNQIVSELAKCVCVCANCHRKVHAGLLDIRHLPKLNADTINMFQPLESGRRGRTGAPVGVTNTEHLRSDLRRL